jgi:FMN phosphatase YigB (HAD superfamily)
MIRAIFFDFYSVWVPDRFSEYLEQARQQNPAGADALQAVIDRYFLGQASPAEVAAQAAASLDRPDITGDQFMLEESDISPVVADFMRNLHGHFVKLGVLANLGVQEYEILKSFNEHTQLFEVIAGPLPLQLAQPLLSQEVFAQALQAIGEPPRSCLVVTGNPAYRQFAEGLGIATLDFEGLPKLQQTLEEKLSSEANA